MSTPRSLVDAHAKAILAELDARKGPDSRSELADSALAVLGTWPELEVRTGPPPPGATGCEVAGAFLASTDPPTLVVARALSAGREAFTALHELAHFLQATSDDLGDALVAQPDGGRTLEEAACDAFAAEILVPAQLSAAHLVGGATPAGVAALWRATTASRSAVCVAASRHLSAPGHVTLLDTEARVLIDATAGEPRVSRGTDLSHFELVARARRSPERRSTGQIHYAYREEFSGHELHAQVGDLDGYLVVVAVTDHAPWRNFTPAPATGPSSRWWTCEYCHDDFEVWGNTCPRCRKPKCPGCDGCGCVVRDRLCTSCFTRYPLPMFVGDSSVCSECSN